MNKLRIITTQLLVKMLIDCNILLITLDSLLMFEIIFRILLDAHFVQIEVLHLLLSYELIALLIVHLVFILIIFLLVVNEIILSVLETIVVYIFRQFLILVHFLLEILWIIKPWYFLFIVVVFSIIFLLWLMVLWIFFQLVFFLL